MDSFKKRLSELVNWSYQEGKFLVDKLTDEESTEIGTLNKWSLKDIIAHIAFWKILRAKSIDDLLKGNTPQEIGDYNKVNEQVFNDYLKRSWKEVLEFSEEANKYLIKITGSLNEESLKNKKTFPLLGDKEIWKIIVIYCCLHPLDHFDKYYLRRGQVYYSINLWKEAADKLEQLPASSGIIGNARYNLSKYYAISGQSFIAARTLDQAIQLNPKLVERISEDPDLFLIKGKIKK